MESINNRMQSQLICIAKLFHSRQKYRYYFYIFTNYYTKTLACNTDIYYLCITYQHQPYMQINMTKVRLKFNLLFNKI